MVCVDDRCTCQGDRGTVVKAWLAEYFVIWWTMLVWLVGCYWGRWEQRHLDRRRGVSTNTDENRGSE